MSRKIMENMEELQAEMKKLCEEPITYRSAERLISCHKAYKIMCEMCGHHDSGREYAHRKDYDHDYTRDEVYKVDVSVKGKDLPEFNQRMAMEWTQGMANADGTRGPHWSMEETNKLHKQYGLKCDPVEFWAVINSLYSDYCEALRESSISTPEVYVRLAKAWIDDRDAVDDKASAYFTCVVKH